ncbi:MAG: hypothetical protein OEQ39_15955 [Gammaproteobacteria bacterium]|nr:hypothetical protein [Gammaproteobacteria bacterium]MDH3467303.1 hypothetical protein [Gammaproteobacteria bacterium]
MSKRNSGLAAVATVLAMSGMAIDVWADEPAWLWQYELSFGRKQTITGFNLAIRSEPTVTASRSRANATSSVRLPLYSSDPSAWSLFRYRADGDRSGGAAGFGTVVVGAVFAWQIYESASAAADAAADRVNEEILRDFELTDFELPETESSQGEPDDS